MTKVNPQNWSQIDLLINNFYEIVEYTLVYLAAQEGGTKNDLSTYVPIWQQTSVHENETSEI